MKRNWATFELVLSSNWAGFAEKTWQPCCSEHTSVSLPFRYDDIHHHFIISIKMAEKKYDYIRAPTTQCMNILF